MQRILGVDIGSPPPQAVEWRVSCGRRSVRVEAQLWWNARIEGAAKLGVPVDKVKCERLEPKRLKSKGLA